MKIAFLMANAEFRERRATRGQCQWAVFQGLKALGHEVPMAVPESGEHMVKGGEYDAIFIWNGMKGHRGTITEFMRKMGGKAFVMERGFFGRFENTQIDHLGFSHRASWAASLGEKAPEGGRERFEALCGPVESQAARESGYILVIGQTGGDSQLRDSEINHPAHLLDAVEAATPKGVEIRFRPHPHYAWRGNKNITRDEGSLRDGVDGARFCVTINSNAGNEAIAWGCPLLCLGPAGAEFGGAALKTGLDSLETAISIMLGGWHPDQNVAENFMYHLASHQYGLDELRDGTALSRLLP